MKRKLIITWQKQIFFSVLLLAINFIAWGQEITVSGTVTQVNTGDPLPGVNVLIEGTQQGTITNAEGYYEISVTSEEALIVFSYVGYLSESVNLEGRTVVDVQLVEDFTALDEVVVIGYGTMRKKDLTGAVASVKTEDIQANKSSNALQALQGKVAGLDLTQSDGQAGSGINITMRGIRSLTAENNPLIMVDGVEYGSTLDINTSDIESIDVLKDIASTAIYGTKGANGVILITTKRGRSGKTTVSYSNYFSYNMPAFMPEIMNGEQYQEKQYEIQIAKAEYNLWRDENVNYDNVTGEVAWDETANPRPWEVFGTVTLDQLIDEAGVADKYELLTSDPTALQLMRDGVSLDYLDMIMENTWSQNHEISISGGGEKTDMHLSLGFMDDKGLIRNDHMNRYNVKAVVDHKISNSLSAGMNILYTYKKHKKRNSKIFTRAVTCGPIGTLYNEDGTYASIPDPVFAYNMFSPMLDEVPGAQIHDVFTNRIFGSTYINWEYKGFGFRSNFGFNINLTKEGEFNDVNSLTGRTVGRNQAIMTNEDEKSYTWNNILTYKKTLGNHNIQLMAGSETYNYVWTNYRMTGVDQPLASTQYYDFNGMAPENTTTESNIREKQLVSFFGRINYSLLERYLFQTTMRYDGASVLSEGNKWESFPSVSVAWRISEEDFLKSISLISNLKIRYSWGVAGNAAVAPYSSQTKLAYELSYYTFDETVRSQYLPLNIGNKELSWEKTKSHNIGVDFGLFNNRLNATVDYYNSETYDLLFEVPQPLVNVFPVLIDNVASTKNRGIEIALNSILVNKNKINWSIDLNFSRNKGEIVALNEGVDELVQQYGSDKMWRVGGPADAFYIYEYDGIYQIEDLQDELQYISQQNAAGDSIEKGRIPMISNNFEPGDIKLKDHNGDGDFTVEDKILLDASPKFIFGIGTSLNVNTELGNFGLRVYGFGRWGQTIEYALYNIGDAKNTANGFNVDAWTPQNTDTRFPRNSEDGNNTSDIHMKALRFVEASYLKIQEITLSYAFPGKWVNRIKVENLEIYVSARNMFVFSELENYDPERGGGYSFPLQKNLIFGLNVNF